MKDLTPDFLSKLFTKNYENHLPDGTLLNLVRRNNITDRSALTGKEEAEAFDNKEYLKLHSSTLRKVDVMASLINHLKRGDLKVNSNLTQIYGLNLSGLVELVRNSWILMLALTLLLYVVLH